MIWFTSDWHIGHNKPFIYEDRGFSSIEEHDTAILKNCNSLVKPDDTLWILGDLALGMNEKEWNRIYKSLYCQDVHFIIGNHDTDSKVDKYIDEYGFELEGYANIFKYSKRKRFYLSHYPTICSNYSDKKDNCIINICGHSHYKNSFQDMDKGLIYHVELDAHGMFPVSIEEIIKDINFFTSSDINVQKDLIKNGI